MTANVDLSVFFSDMGRRRYQHPKIQQTTARDKSARRWYFRARIDALMPDGAGRVEDRIYLGSVAEMNRREAEKARDEALQAINAPDVILTSQIRFGKVLDRFLLTAAVRESTHISYGSIINKHIRPQWGDSRMCDITPVAVEDWLLALSKNCTRQQFKNIKSRFGEIWKRAIFWRFTRDACPTTGMQRIMRFGKADRSNVLPTLEQFHRFLYLLDEPYRSIVVVCTFTGLRISEAMALTVAQLNSDAAVITEGVIQRTGKVGPLKAKHSERTISMRHMRGDIFLPCDAAPIDRPYRVGYKAVQSAIKEAAKTTGIDYPGFGCHTFRRMHNTMFRRASGDVNLAMGQLGHGDRESNDIYFVEGAEEVQRRAEVVAMMRHKVMESVN